LVKLTHFLLSFSDMVLENKLADQRGKWLR